MLLTLTVGQAPPTSGHPRWLFLLWGLEMQEQEGRLSARTETVLGPCCSTPCSGPRVEAGPLWSLGRDGGCLRLGTWGNPGL